MKLAIFLYNLSSYGVDLSNFSLVLLGMQLQVHALMGFFFFVEEGMPIVS